MEQVAFALAKEGRILRSGCAPGADSAFEKGAREAGGTLELFLPWPNFEDRADAVLGEHGRHSPAPWTFPIAEQFHPKWGALKPGGKRLHARNVHQILGPEEDSEWSRFVICWTGDGKASGGTGQAMRIAEHYEIPIFNLQRSADLNRIKMYLSKGERHDDDGI